MSQPPRRSRLSALAAAVAVVAVLYLARDVLIPVALAALLSFCLAPLALKVQALIGRVGSVIVAVTVAVAVLGGVAWLVAGQLTELATMVPQYRENITAKISSLQGGVVEQATEAVKEIEKDVKAQREEQKREEKREEAQARQEAAQEGEAKVAAEGAEAGRDPGAAPAREGQDPGAAPVREGQEPGRERAPAVPDVGEPGTPAAGADEPPTGEEEDPIKVQVVEPEPTSFELLAGAFGPLLGPLALAGMVIVLVVFMLLARQDLRDRIVRLVGRSRIGLTTQALDEAGRRVSRYLLMQTLINGLTGLAVAVGMLVLGVPGFFVWGLLSALLRFVPYVGPWIAAAMPVLVALAVFDGWTTPLMVIGCFVLIELVSNNVLEPWLYGTSAGVSPLAVIVMAIFWTWLWGPVGLLLATPITVCLVVMGKYVPQMHFVNILFGDEPVLEPHARFYQRLVARNVDEAGEVAQQFLTERRSLLETLDTVMLPALAMVETDLDTEEFDETRARRAQEALREILRELGEAAEDAARNEQEEPPAGLEQRGLPAEKGEPPPPPAPPLPSLPASLRVLVLPAGDEADEIAGTMVQQLVRASGAACDLVAAGSLSDGLVDVVQQHPADLIVVSAVPPAAIAHARHVHKRLRARFPDVPVVVGVWTRASQLEDARARLGGAEGTAVVSTLRDALAEIDRLARAAATGIQVGAGAPR